MRGFVCVSVCLSECVCVCVCLCVSVCVPAFVQLLSVLVPLYTPTHPPLNPSRPGVSFYVSAAYQGAPSQRRGSHAGRQQAQTSCRGTSPIRNRRPLEPYSSPTPRALRWS